MHELFQPHFLLIVLLPKKEGRKIVGLFLFDDNVYYDDYGNDKQCDDD
jgi:hypothetical protein